MQTADYLQNMHLVKSGWTKKQHTRQVSMMKFSRMHQHINLNDHMNNLCLSSNISAVSLVFSCITATEASLTTQDKEYNFSKPLYQR